MLHPNDAVMLLIDHQAGLFQLVRDMDQYVLRNNVAALAKGARLAKIPCFTTASVPDGPNGPLIPEIQMANPDAVYIPRSGQINAWDNPEWVKAIERTGRKTLIMAGTLTSVCLAFPALSAIESGYRVFCVVDASGSHSQMATDLTIARLAQAGAFPIDTMAMHSEIMSTWNRPEAMEYGQIMVDHILPPYKGLVESYNKAKSVQEKGMETKMEKAPAMMSSTASQKMGITT